jgi:hypothetical protein
MTRRLTLLAALLLAGCATTSSTITEGPAQPGSATEPATATSRYEVEAGRDAALVAEMRAAPAPQMPEMQAGQNRAGDRDRLAAQGQVRIGSGYFPHAQTQANEEALQKGRQVGAERTMLYAPVAAASAWIADYYVRFKLPFGATFRDLRAQERTTLGTTGGVAIGSVVGGTPASRANLIAGDFVLALDGKPIMNRADFQDQLKRNAGRSVTLSIVRNGETLSRVVRLGLLSANDKD